jgi:hypothetical protein
VTPIGNQLFQGGVFESQLGSVQQKTGLSALMEKLKEFQLGEQQNVNMAFGMQAMSEAVKNDPVASIISFLA